MRRTLSRGGIIIVRPIHSLYRALRRVDIECFSCVSQGDKREQYRQSGKCHHQRARRGTSRTIKLSWAFLKSPSKYAHLLSRERKALELRRELQRLKVTTTKRVDALSCVDERDLLVLRVGLPTGDHHRAICVLPGEVLLHFMGLGSLWSGGQGPAQLESSSQAISCKSLVHGLLAGFSSRSPCQGDLCNIPT